MINKELELTINNQKLLERLASNLNIKGVTESTSIKKIANAFEVEMRNYGGAIDNSIANAFLSSMDLDLFMSFAASYGIYRKVYSNINLRPVDNIVSITINPDTAFGELPKNSIPFRKGDILYGNENFTIKVTEDVVFESSSSSVSPHLTITLNTDSGFTIHEQSIYVVSATQSDITMFVPEFIIKFNSTIGLVRAEESLEDFRLRVYEATYLANNMANSLVASITKEVPSITFMETAEIEDGRAIDVLYPYTDDLIRNGFDDTLSTYIIPMIETSLSNKTVYSNMVRVSPPKALPITAKFKAAKNKYITSSLLDEIAREFNVIYFKTPTITVKQIKDILVVYLKPYNITYSDIDIIFIDPYIGESVYNLTDAEKITIETGRFLHLSSVEEIRND